MAIIDTMVGGVAVISTTGGNTILNAAQLQGGTISVTGALVSNAGLIFPAVQGWWSIENLTTGTSVLFVSAGSGAQVICLPPGEITDIQINGNVAKYRNLARIGSYLDLATVTVPAWITQSSVPPYLLCDGSSFSAVTYPALNALIGASVTPDLRGRTRAMVNLGTNRITGPFNGNNLFAAGGDQNLQGHVHGVIGNTGDDSPDHTHSLNGGAQFVVGSSSVGNGNASPGAAGPPVTISGVSSGASVRHQHAINFNSQSAGLGGAQNVQPTAMHGITLIRAG